LSCLLPRFDHVKGIVGRGGGTAGHKAGQQILGVAKKQKKAPKTQSASGFWMVSIHKRIMFSVSNSFLGVSQDFNKKYERLSTLYQFLNLFCLTQAGKLLNIDTSNCPMCRKSLRKCEAMIFHNVPGKIISQKPESSKRGGNLGKN